MNKICKNAKNYKLTEGKIYEVLLEEDDYIRIINDNGKNVRFHSSLFEDEPSTIPTPILRTELDCINSIVYQNNQLSYTDINNIDKITTVNLTRNSNNGFSCGIVRFEGLNNLINHIENDEFVNTDEDDLLELKQALFLKVINYWIDRETSTGMWMFSTNFQEDFEDYYTILDEESTSNSGWFFNPNSGNQIKLWYGIINQQ